MKITFAKRILLASVAALSITAAPIAVSHLDDKEMGQSYRQSWFALVALNFGPMTSMLKGDIPWNDAQMANWGKELGALASMDGTRGFAPGSEKGTTRAKPEIWKNMDDFKAKMGDFTEAATNLAAVSGSGDKKAIAGAIAATGKSCKGCHDEYKAENYLY
ncbi:MAG: cytochrome c [Halioglobus sp.]